MAKAKEEAVVYIALTPIEHDGIFYAEGAMIDLPEATAIPLLATGAIALQ